MPPSLASSARRSPRGMPLFFSAAHVSRISDGLDKVVDRIGALTEAVAEQLKAPPPPPPSPAPAPVTAPEPAPAAAAPSADLTPYLDKLSDAMKSLAEAPRGAAAEVIQTLDQGVYNVLERMFSSVDDQLLPLVRGFGRRVKGTELESDRRLGDQLDRALKELDTLKSLLAALRKIDTRRLASPSRD